MASKSKTVIITTVIALLAQLIVGLGLVIISLLFIAKIVENNPISVGILNLELVGFVLLLLGVLILICGFIESARFLKLTRAFLEKPNYGLESETHFSESPQEISHRGPTIIRPSMPETRRKTPEPKKIQRSAPKPSVSTPAVQNKPVKKPTQKVSGTDSSGITLDEALANVVTGYNTVKTKKAFKGWYNTLMMSFPDIGRSFLYKISGDEGIEFSEGVQEDAEVQVNMDSTVYLQMADKTLNPIKAYSSGLLEVKGEMKNLLKLKKLKIF